LFLLLQLLLLQFVVATADVVLSIVDIAGVIIGGGVVLDAIQSNCYSFW